MKVDVQVYTTKGFYGPPIYIEVPNVAAVSGAMVEALERLPDELEGEKLMDWTKISVEVTRG